jgi:hypothetical protein
VAAKTINTDVDTLYNAWDEGESLADVAQAHNVDLQQVTDAIVTAEKAWVDQMVGSDEFTQAEADEWLQDLNQNAVFFVMMGDEVDWEEVTAKAIGMDVDALFTAMMDGDASIAEVAQANGIDPQQVAAGNRRHRDRREGVAPGISDQWRHPATGVRYMAGGPGDGGPLVYRGGG